VIFATSLLAVHTVRFRNKIPGSTLCAGRGNWTATLRVLLDWLDKNIAVKTIGTATNLSQTSRISICSLHLKGIDSHYERGWSTFLLLIGALTMLTTVNIWTDLYCVLI
jgi:hypothetical protein